jgi:hypothetical protein
VNGPGLPGGKGPAVGADKIPLLTALGSAGFLAAVSAGLAVANQSNAAQGQVKFDAFGVEPPGGRPDKDMAVIIALARETNGTLRDIDKKVLAAFRGTPEGGATPTTHTPTSSEARGGMPEVRQWHYDNGKKITTSVENLRRDIGPSLSKTPVEVAKVKTATIAAGVAAKNAGATVKTATVAAGVAAKNAGDKTKAAALAAGVKAAASSRSAGATTAAAARAAGVTAKSGGLASAAAIRAKKMSVTTNTRVSVNLSGREWLAQATQTNIRGGAS